MIQLKVGSCCRQPSWESRRCTHHAPLLLLAGDYLQVKCHACVGGTSVREDARILGAGVHVVVGTPGRVYDMLRRRCLRADSIKMFTLDEADEMLSRGFKDQIYDIYQLLPPKLQVGPRVGALAETAATSTQGGSVGLQPGLGFQLPLRGPQQYVSMLMCCALMF